MAALEALTDGATSDESMTAVRALVEAIVLAPEEGARPGSTSAANSRRSSSFADSGERKPSGEALEDLAQQVKLVAGARNEFYLHLVAPRLEGWASR